MLPAPGRYPILDYQAGLGEAEPLRANETHSLQPGTSAWAAFGTPTDLPGPADSKDTL